VLSFYIIPPINSKHSPFTVDNYAGTPNLIWISNLTPILINTIFFILIFFIGRNIKEEENRNHTVLFFQISVKNKFTLLMYRVLGLFLYCVLISFILELSILIINYQPYNIFLFFVPYFYFCLPFLFFISTFSTIIEFYVENKVLKYLSLFIIIILIFSIKASVDFTGLQELIFNFKEYININDPFFVIGKSNKPNLTFITFQDFIYPKNILEKLLIIILSLALLFIFSVFYNRNYKIKTSPESGSSTKNSITAGTHAVDHKSLLDFETPNIHVGFLQLLKADLLLLQKSIDQKTLGIIVLMWLFSFMAAPHIKIIFVAIIFILLVSLNKKYLYNSFTNNFYEKSSVFKSYEFILTKILLLLIYIIAALPILIGMSPENMALCIVKLALLFIIQVFYIKIFKDYLLSEVVLVILFASYLTSNPIINIF
jgi:hypothetical protein